MSKGDLADVTDLLTSFQINPALPALAAVVPLRAAPVSLPAGAVPTLDFGATIAGLIGPTHRSPESETLQDDAAGGKNLPQPGDVTPDPSIIWLPGGIVPPDHGAAPTAKEASAELVSNPTPTTGALTTANPVRPDGSDVSQPPAARLQEPLAGSGAPIPEQAAVSVAPTSKAMDQNIGPADHDPPLPVVSLRQRPAADATSMPDSASPKADVNGAPVQAQPIIPVLPLVPERISIDADRPAVTAVVQPMPPSPASPIQIQAAMDPGTIPTPAQLSELLASAVPDQHLSLLTPAADMSLAPAPLEQPQLASVPVQPLAPATAASIAAAGLDLPISVATPVESATLADAPPIAAPSQQPAATPAPLPTLATAPPASVTPIPAPLVASPFQQPQPAAVPVQPSAPALVAQTDAAPARVSAAATRATPDPVLAAPDEAGNQPATRFAHAPMMREAAPQPALVPLAPQAALPVALTSGAAAQVFATALSTAPVDLQRRGHAAEPELLLAGMVPIEQRQVVQAMSQAAPGTLDLANDDWPTQMIDRIAALRDTAESADTRIKLAPENLGALEVSIRRDGDRIHVHFTADTATARQLIADAAPRLAELADARGVKLGQTSVDGGGQHGSQRDAQHQHQSRSPARNVTVAAHSDPATDERIA